MSKEKVKPVKNRKQDKTVDMARVKVISLEPPPDPMAIPDKIKEEAEKKGMHLCMITEDLLHSYLNMGYVKVMYKDEPFIIRRPDGVHLLMWIPLDKYEEIEYRGLIQDAINRSSIETQTGFKPG